MVGIRLRLATEAISGLARRPTLHCWGARLRRRQWRHPALRDVRRRMLREA